MNHVPPFPSAVSLTHLRVYPWETSDGSAGGSPHVHLASAEAYVPTAGRGAVEILTREGSRTLSLEPGAIVWFEPGTIHRLHNQSGDLELLVVMQNAGLPEAGDAILTFRDEILASPNSYTSAAALGPGSEQARLDAVRHRRDAAIEGFLCLRERVNGGELTALDTFYRQAVRLKREFYPDWRQTWEAGPLREAVRTGLRLEGLARGEIDELQNPEWARLDLENAHAGVGMCGRLDAFLPEGVATPNPT